MPSRVPRPCSNWSASGFRTRFGFEPIADIQVLCPTNRGQLGTRTLNQALQAKLNPDATDRIERQGVSFALGDKVMQLENDYDREVYNGDIGHITAIDRAQNTLCVEVDGRPLSYSFTELDQLVPGLRDHGAQGAGLGVSGHRPASGQAARAHAQA